MLVNGTHVALCSKDDLATHLRSPELAQRCILATRLGLPGWVEIIRDGRNMLLSAKSVVAVGRRIASGEMPPQYQSKLAAGAKQDAARSSRTSAQQ